VQWTGCYGVLASIAIGLRANKSLTKGIVLTSWVAIKTYVATNDHVYLDMFTGLLCQRKVDLHFAPKMTRVVCLHLEKRVSYAWTNTLSCQGKSRR
jgi:hypothetical protein